MKVKNLFILLSIFTVSLIFTACDKEETTITAYGSEYQIKRISKLTLRIEPEYQLNGMLMNDDAVVPVFIGYEEPHLNNFVQTFTSNEIEGFNYEEGNTYLIRIKAYEIKNPPADASDIIYKLEKVIEQEHVGYNIEGEKEITIDIPANTIEIQHPLYNDEKATLRVYQALIEETGEQIQLLNGEIMGFYMPYHSACKVKASIVPCTNPTALTGNKFKLRYLKTIE